jgi:hypothetical protein
VHHPLAVFHIIPQNVPMAQSDTQPNGDDAPRIAQDARLGVERVGPLRRFTRWIWGHPREREPSILQIRAEWAEYQIAFNDLLTKFSALLARQAKAEKDHQRRLAESNPESPAERAPAPRSPKAELRSALAARLYGDRIGRILAEKQENGNESGE